MTDIDELLNEAPTAQPCGPEMTYAAEFLALEQLARGKIEQQYGDTIIPAEDPDWQSVESSALQLLKQSKDMRVAGLLCRSWTNTEGLVGLTCGLELMGALLEKYWDDIHPLPEEGDYFMRMNAVAMLNDVTGLLRELRQTEFLASNVGHFTVRDAEALARGQRAESNAQLTLDQLRLGIAHAMEQGRPPLLAMPRAKDALDKLVRLCGEKLPHHQQPDLANIQSLVTLLNALLPKKEQGVEAPADPADGPVAFTTKPAAGLEIRSREDAIRQLVKIAEFLESTEPTNPASLLIRRSAKLMGMSFIDILRELAPQSLQQIEMITGVQPEQTS
ncbi:type VI secretion system protein TssA [Acidovorax sp. HMWF029]|jgi:type VI secretion system protein ImpA|uniref:type VI secretion system protein TssA n=1 Tax=unclassified Acidovorax TaxID=2684926 RepID=UPI000D38F3BE|nr:MULTISPECIES: type VI secretion system protein TssA [unclassified Acidovorax]MDH4417315.1 type VI secretion system protein TssA [Acidovorax sp.]PTT21917.1 type VI secretion system protein TssA [Acidovorax sp. HMWF029]